MRRLLRVLPGKRIVGEAEYAGLRVLAKLFIAVGSERHWQQEKAGVEALHEAGLPTPDIVCSSPFTGGGFALLTRFFPDAVSLIERWRDVACLPVAAPEALAVLKPVLEILARMHQSGLKQDDLHLGNFLCVDQSLLVIDGDSVQRVGRPLSIEAAAGNLGMLLAQLPAAWDAQCAALLKSYVEANGIAGIRLDMLQAEINRVRAWRLKDFLAKSVRDCTLFEVSTSASKFSSVRRMSAGRLSGLLANLDNQLDKGLRLKSGNTCTVGRVASPDGDVVVKRYNLKNTAHALSRMWRPSRAWHSWREGHRLGLFGIATPLPLALVEERFGPLRRRAWLVNEYCPGESLAVHLSPDAVPPTAEAQAIASLFSTLHRLRISHGDLKATNLLWHAGQVWLIDLDACTQHRSDDAYRKAWRRDRARLLRNWPANSKLVAWLQEHLPRV
ncbi:MAG: hypothetical protein H6943_02975 [Zoogloeaceae bacterium]|nr:hypothetical protein [Zoogloeaceae bacterium]